MGTQRLVRCVQLTLAPIPKLRGHMLRNEAIR